MDSIYFNMNVNDDLRRQRLYDGQLFVYSPTAGSLAFCDFAKEMVRQAFGSLDPETAQFSMPVEEYAALLADLKPKFIHHPRSKECIQGLLRDLKCDLNKTYFDVPRLRTSTSDNYLTSGIAYAFHMHRDTWYSAPFSQINWWIPVYDLTQENTMAFHPFYWSHPVRNGSRDYNYTEWNRESRKDAAKHIKGDTRKQPKAEEPIDPDPQIRFVAPAGSILLFSAAQMHSSVRNTSGRTRISIDFRTVHVDDVVAHRGAPNIDSECTGTTMRDYLRGTDLSHVSEEICVEYDTQPSPA
jgi:Phytanoyl-CoA dioxygenase (PhyH)